MHRVGDRAVNRHAAEWMAGQIPGRAYVELPGIDHSLLAGDTDAVIDEVEEFLTGARRAAEVDRVLATVMFTDIVGSTDASRRARGQPVARRCSRRTPRSSAASWTGSVAAR